jgi:tRNA pseudouridine38-40 synthase
LQKTGSIFIGKHDFTTFSKLNEETNSYVCDVHECKWDKVSPIEWKLKIKADRFVYGMVRSIVGAMIDIARGKRELDEISSALKSCDRSLSSPLAPAHGLILEKIYYPENLKIF